MEFKLFDSSSNSQVINELAQQTNSIGFIILSAFSGLVGLLLMIAAIYTGIKIVYSSGEKRKSNIIHLIIILVIFVVIVIIFAIGVNFAVDITTRAASNSGQISSSIN
ncbi:Mbov_0395 family pilin-like conjugal transfer protein [Mesomycoplasma lagogenitalium]|uniref:Uncharacterized protein n=1 Tax=Mesomycoplasma lagogenitalium TaxID=171286 RepID=A0ABY8LSQ0_9BACT|nr:hypothetical protein [Mesomycoplasma lagogenitalium]WGI36292.1 hypothetical protein QEG99_02320 [Mesomycoplasma lagogenitalium]